MEYSDTKHKVLYYYWKFTCKKDTRSMDNNIGTSKLSIRKKPSDNKTIKWFIWFWHTNPIHTSGIVSIKPLNNTIRPIFCILNIGVSSKWLLANRKSAMKSIIWKVQISGVPWKKYISAKEELEIILLYHIGIIRDKHFFLIKLYNNRSGSNVPQ